MIAVVLAVAVAAAVVVVVLTCAASHGTSRLGFQSFTRAAELVLGCW
jgi:hypothetical protein